jgi:hypothetical protein
VISNSWGYGDFGYGQPTCGVLDAYLWYRQDLLLVFAGGTHVRVMCVCVCVCHP